MILEIKGKLLNNKKKFVDGEGLRLIEKYNL